ADARARGARRHRRLPRAARRAALGGEPAARHRRRSRRPARRALGIDALLQLAPDALPRRETIAIDAGVAVFAVGPSLLCSVVFGLVPAWQATRDDIVDMMKRDPASPRRASATRGLIVAAQLALSLVLLVGAGLMARAFVVMRSVPLGFDPRDAMTMNVHL